MNELRLRFSDGDQPDLVVGGGVHALGRLPTGLGPVDGEESWLLRVSNDRRGLWLTVADVDPGHGVTLMGRLHCAVHAGLQPDCTWRGSLSASRPAQVHARLPRDE